MEPRIAEHHALRIDVVDAEPAHFADAQTRAVREHRGDAMSLQREGAEQQRAARALKAMSGVLLTVFGAVFLLAPGLLAGG